MSNRLFISTVSAVTGLAISGSAHAQIAYGIDALFLGSPEVLVTFDPMDPLCVTTVVGPLGLAETQFATGLDFTPDGRLWATAFDTADGSSLLLELSKTCGTPISSATITGLRANESATDLAYDADRGVMLILTVDSNVGSTLVRALGTDGVATFLAEFPTLPAGLGLAVTVNGDVYIEDITNDVIARFDKNFNLLDSLALPFDAEFNQGLGADWSRSGRLILAGVDLNGPPNEQSVSYSLRPDLSDLTFHGAFGGSAVEIEICDVAYQPVPCRGDVDFDGGVGFTDLLVILGNWGPCR